MVIRVTFETEIPDGHSDETITEWIRYALSDNGEMSANNPLVDRVPEPVFGTFDWVHA